MSDPKADARRALERLGPHLKGLREAVVAAHEKALANAGQSSESAAVSVKVKQAMLHLACMKEASRALYNAKAEHLRDASIAKEEFEATSLRLQNLQYARDQLMREIQRCRDFPTVEMDQVNMMSEKEFCKATGYKPGKTANSSNDETDVPAHQMMLRRLEHEITSRNVLAEKLDSLKGKAKETEIATGLKTRFLADANDRLRALEEATLPLQRFFGLEMTKADAQHLDAIKKLAGPLYVIYRQLDSYSRTVSEVAKSTSGELAEGSTSTRYSASVTLTIVPAVPYIDGGISSAKSYSDVPCIPTLTNRHVNSTSRKRKRGHRGGSEQQGDKKEQACSVGEVEENKGEETAELLVFPYAVLANISPLDSKKKNICVRFQLVPALNTVTAELDGNETAKGKSDSEDSDPERDYLGNLFQGDSGLEVGDYCSEKLQTAAEKALNRGVASMASTGRAYLWVQGLSGAKMLMRTQQSMVRPSVPSIIHALLR